MTDDCEPKRPRGRPRLTNGSTKACIFSVRLSRSERDAIEAMAKVVGMKASDWARGVLLAAAVD